MTFKRRVGPPRTPQDNPPRHQKIYDEVMHRKPEKPDEMFHNLDLWCDHYVGLELPWKRMKFEFERRILEAAMRRYWGNCTLTARLFKYSKQYLMRRLALHGILSEEFKHTFEKKHKLARRRYKDYGL